MVSQVQPNGISRVAKKDTVYIDNANGIDDVQNNLKTVAQFVIGGIVGSITGGCLAGNRNFGIMVAATITVAGSALALLITFRPMNRDFSAVVISPSAPVPSMTPMDSQMQNWLKTVVDYVKANPITTVISYTAGSLLGGYLYIDRGMSFGIMAVAVPAIGSGAIFAKYAVSKAGTALWEAVSQSAATGKIRAILDYAYDNPITTAASAIAGIAGSIFGPLYSQTAITQAGILVFNEMMVTGVMHAAQNGGVTPLVTQTVFVAANNARASTVFRLNLAMSLASGLGAAMIPHVFNYWQNNF